MRARSETTRPKALADREAHRTRRAPAASAASTQQFRMSKIYQSCVSRRGKNAEEKGKKCVSGVPLRGARKAEELKMFLALMEQSSGREP